MSLIGTDKFTIIVGLGKTGVSCARYLASQNEPFGVVDTRDTPSQLAAFKTEFPNVAVECGELNADTLSSATRLLISPGISRELLAIKAAEANGVEISGDVDLFCQRTDSPIIAITGSNAKSTVTTLVGDMARHAGVNVAVGGNIGVPVLDLLSRPKAELYVLELSSFQLETTSHLRAKAATILNISEDHMDRYGNLSAYHRAKQRIYRGCEAAVFNASDLLTQPLLADDVAKVSFRLGVPDISHFGVRYEGNQPWLAKGLELLLPVSELKIPGQHNVANALAALALGEAVGLDMPAMLNALRSFEGLPHRCQWTRSLNGVNYYNDSKGTNVGATVAAIEGFAPQLGAENRVVLIAGGDSKGADFTDLIKPLNAHGRAVVLIGRDREHIASALQGGVPVYREDDFQSAVLKSRELAVAGDVVLLSPACASFDMFSGFEDRGDQFMQLVRGL